MKKIMSALGAIAVAGVLVACAPVEGTVTAKTYKPDEGYWAYVTVPYVDAKGQTTIRQEYRYHPNPECYGIHVRTDEGKHRSQCIGAEEWNSLEIGDYRDGK